MKTTNALIISFLVFLSLGSMAWVQNINDSLWVTNGQVNAIVTSGNTIYIGGAFTYVGPATGCGALLDTSTAQFDRALPRVDGRIFAVTPDGIGGWYIGGDFSSVGGVTRNNLAHIQADKTLDMNWNPNAHGTASKLAVSGSIVYAGGGFTRMGGHPRNCIAAIDISTGHATGWNPDAEGMVSALAVSGSTVYVGGSFPHISNSLHSNFAGMSSEFPFLTFHVNPGWNIVSVPVVPDDFRTTQLFPPALSYAFAYKGSYISKDTLAVGAGYWVKYAIYETINMSGSMVSSATVNVRSGWNLIGSISTPVPVDGITSIPGGMITSDLFGYSGNHYVIVDTVVPGRGYWIKVNNNCQLILSTGGVLAKAVNRIQRLLGDTPPPPPGGDAEAETNTQLPTKFALSQNYPNPFNPSTIINYQLPAESRVSLKVYNIFGQEVATLLEGKQDAGYKSVEWSAANLPSGVYFYRLRAGTLTETKKLLLLR